MQITGYENVMIMMTGEVTEGDAQRFDDIVAGLGGTDATLNVSGPGGLVNEALDIGAQVQEHRFATMVSTQAECYSACALIWLAGPRRYLSPESIIGVHAAFRTAMTKSPKNRSGERQVGAFLNSRPSPRRHHIRQHGSADRHASDHPRVARNLGIEVYATTWVGDQSPQMLHRPRTSSPAVLLNSWASLGIVLELLQLDSDTVRGAAQGALQTAHENFGEQRMADIVSWMPSEVRANIEQVRLREVVFRDRASLRAEGLSFGFDGPSFDCSKAASATERAICDDPKLWGRDRAIELVLHG